eukprot:TRINITY_DN54827_c0_g1_i1.p2 TRINITY_DN54827_c0_g1~~TRINITY_DN54827_c0_g1_i1.p2  ORF type:complete len:147 (+),score=30.06 TRINITY_DN54827_c0_g1_i1:71-511(+)
MLNLARKAYRAVSGKKKSGGSGAAAGGTAAGGHVVVDGILLDDDAEPILYEGQVLHVDQSGCLNLGNMDHVYATSQSCIQALPTRTLQRAEDAGEQRTCWICQDDFAARDVVRTLPCGHVYHQGCIDQWLRVSKNCAVCERCVEAA